MLKAAFPYWDNRIAPVFDSARHVCLVDTEGGRIVRQTRLTMPGGPPARKAMFLLEQGVHTLVCGAISSQLREMGSAYGIGILPFRAGDLDEVIAAWLAGRAGSGVFAMPGCCGGGRGRGRGRNCRYGQDAD